MLTHRYSAKPYTLYVCMQWKHLLLCCTSVTQSVGSSA